MLTVGQTLETDSKNIPSKLADLGETEKWNAVLSRDASYNGVFVFAVRSTGIYCRPSCPAKRPAREQVAFFSQAIEAERSGFRACRRCLPRETETPNAKIIDLACKYMEANLQNKLSLRILSSQVGLSPSYFQKTFKRVLGITPREYIAARRLARMKDNLRRGETVNESLFNAGFSSKSRVYENQLKGFGMNPGEFRRGGKGLEVQYGITDSPLGRLLVAATQRGVCGVYIGDSDAFVEQSIGDDYPSAVLFRNDESVKELTRAFERYFDGDHQSLNLPVDVTATAFQTKVWKTIQSIPWGETATYSQLALKLDIPNGSRAIARACATNPVAIVIPCHRVIGKDGKLHGYRWGVTRKKSLLDFERRVKQRTLVA